MTVYNSDADGQDLFTFCDDLVNTDSTSYPVKAKARAINKCLKDIWTWIFASYGGWQYDDSNQTDLPSATTTITADQTAYALPTTAIAVKGIEVKNTGSVWMRLFPITDEQIRDKMAVGEFYKTSATPLYYQQVGTTIKIFPASNWTQASSFKVFFDRDAVTIASTATSTTPGFATPFHEAVSVGAAMIYAKRKGLPQLNALIMDWQDYEKRIKSFYVQRYEQMFPPRATVRDAAKEAM